MTAWDFAIAILVGVMCAAFGVIVDQRRKLIEHARQAKQAAVRKRCKCGRLR